MKKSIASILLLIGLLSSSSLQAQNSTRVAFDSGGNSLLYANAAKTIPLSAGGANTAFDGAMLQLGYYTQATALTPFAGSFIALAGRGSANTGLGNISIGDDPTQGPGAGQFALSLTFTAGDATTGNNLPATGQQLAVAFYNGTTLANSTLYNVATSASWLFIAPGNPQSSVAFSFDSATIQFLGGANTAFFTSQPVVPEPSTYVMAFGGLVALVVFARRRQVAA